MNVLKELLICLKPCGFAYIGLGWDSGRLARTIDRRSTVSTCFSDSRLGHRALDGWRGRGRPRPQCW